MNDDYSDDYETFVKKTYKKANKKSSKKSKNDDNCRDDLPGMFSDLFSSINYKTAIFLFILGVLIFSDVFIDLFLMPIDGAVYADAPTNKGTFIQLLLLTFGYIIIDLMIQGEIL